MPLRQSVLVATTGETDGPDDGRLLALFRSIASRDRRKVERLVGDEPDLGLIHIRVGASRQDPDKYFLESIHHYVYAGDTALHIAGGAHQPELAMFLVRCGADVRARNRLGAEPLHYAADGHPGSASWDREGQRRVIACLIDEGAEPDAVDDKGVAALHRAVRTRSTPAVKALIEGGANARLKNKSGSTPLHLAVQATGKGNSGSDAAKDEQRQIIVVLLEHGASPVDVDEKGKSVAAAASSGWVLQLLEGA